MDSPSWVLVIHLILGQQVKGQVTVSQSAKHISVEGDRVADVSLHCVEYTSSSYKSKYSTDVVAAVAQRITVRRNQ